jgi:hypothetical protein
MICWTLRSETEAYFASVAIAGHAPESLWWFAIPHITSLEDPSDFEWCKTAVVASALIADHLFEN